ncbi:MAG TPA: hypothetical protein VN641_10345, partial [Urbifossiella sp.]|nr:hypothetical protein [Urbifossiella sp.]
LVWLLIASPAAAHEGPPFPIIMDQRAGPYLVSVWTDPDIGTGTFFVIISAAPGTELPGELQVQVCVAPASGRLPEVCYSAARQNLRDKVQYFAEVPFDQQEMWKVRIRIEAGGKAEELFAEVEATPPGYGRWDLLIYSFPFVLFGGLWLYAALRRRFTRKRNLASRERERPESQNTPVAHAPGSPANHSSKSEHVDFTVLSHSPDTRAG